MEDYYLTNDEYQNVEESEQPTQRQEESNEEFVERCRSLNPYYN